MAQLSIIIHPDPRLKKVSTKIVEITERIRRLSLDMLDTMYQASGVGLAAPQVGILERLVVMDCSNEGEKKEIILINPQIVWSSEEKASFEEGCLSIPDIRENITRPKSVLVKFTGLDNERREEIFQGLWATCIQHEIDHLDGKLFIDYLGPMKRSLITRKMKKLKKELSRKL
tara:strand:- start:179 stop:697 length:519 start_codon:yes stop_codon:yes gene_type:complete